MKPDLVLGAGHAQDFSRSQLRMSYQVPRSIGHCSGSQPAAVVRHRAVAAQPDGATVGLIETNQSQMVRHVMRERMVAEAVRHQQTSQRPR